jgi:pimeloyl-ACP methyl ester carboxylesterase/class 3 adenylate cyclase
MRDTAGSRRGLRGLKPSWMMRHVEVRKREVRYVRTDEGVHLAYQTVGDGPIDLLFVPGYASNLHSQWELPSYSRFLDRLASFARLICVDRRGAGLSDRFSVRDLPPVEDLARDLESVLDAVGSERAAIFGAEDGGMIAAMLAATRPERVSGLILYAMHASPEPNSAWDTMWQQIDSQVDERWGTTEYARWDTGLSNPSRVDDGELVEWLAMHQRLSASPASAAALLKIYHDTDLRGLLPAIATPTLVLHRRDDRLTPLEHAREIVGLIPGSRLIELPGDDHYWAVGNEDIADEIERFVASLRRVDTAFDRVLATVLFTDIVDSTAQAAALGDGRWQEVREQHDRLVRGNLARFRGKEIKTMGDGFLATFDGPARGVRCAESIAGAVRHLGIEIRAGLHTGEVALEGDDVTGLGVAIGARVGALAQPSEVLVSQTVKDLVAGSGLEFDDAGEHELKGVPDRWHLYRVVM